MTRRLLVSVLAVFLAVASLQAQRDPQAQRPPAPGGTGRIAGTVVAADSGRPVRFARVLVASNTGEHAAVTGDDGAFSFEKLQPGAYLLYVSRPGFLAAKFGQARPGTETSGRRIRLADGQQITRLEVPLSQGGSIAGTVRDDRGEPVFQATVRVQQWMMRNGTRTLLEVGSTNTDERGAFRVGLLPSRHYVVSATPTHEAMHEGDSKAAPLGFAPVFFPTALSAGAADTILLGVGEHRTGTDLVMPLVKLSKITGVVVDAEGRPVPDLPVQLQSGSDEHGASTDARGGFEFPRLAPGSYTITAGRRHFGIEFEGGPVMIAYSSGGDVVSRAYSRNWVVSDVVGGAISGSAINIVAGKIDEAVLDKPPAERARGTATAEITVAGDAIPDIVLRLEPPREVTGRVVLEGNSPKPGLNTIQVALVSASGREEEYSAKIAADGTFTLSDVTPGKYFVESRSPGSLWTLASAMSSGVDTLESHLDVPRDRNVADLTLTFRDRRTSLSGTVSDSLGESFDDRTVILFPADERLWADGDRRIHAVDVSENGEYSFTDVRPGAYQLALVAGVEQQEWLLPEFLRRLAASSVAVTLAEGQKKTQDLRVR